MKIGPAHRNDIYELCFRKNPTLFYSLDIFKIIPNKGFNPIN